MKRYAKPAIVLALCALVASTALEILQARDTIQMVPADLDYRLERWATQPVCELVPDELGVFYPSLVIPGLDDQAVGSSNAVLRMKLPFRPDGYVLHVSGREDVHRRPFRFECSVNDHHVGDIAGNDGPTIPAQSGRLFLCPQMLSVDATNELRIRFVEGPRWTGNIILRPGAAASLQPMLLPVTAFLFLASLVFGIREERLSWGYPLALFTVFLAVYRLTFSADNLSPMAEQFFSDGLDFLIPIILNRASGDTFRHMLFLPFMHGLYRGCALFTSSQVQAMAAVFALVGAANVTVAHLWIRRFIPSFRCAALVSLVYGFAFSTWVYASTYETCIPSTLAANTVMLVIMRPSRGWMWLAAVTIALAVAALFQPPLLILFGVVALAVRNRGYTRPVLVAAAVGVAVVTLFLAGQVGIRALYSKSGAHPKSERHAQGVKREVHDFTRLFERFAFREKDPVVASGNVAMGQFVYALAGLPWPNEWSDGWSGLRTYIKEPAALPGPLCILLLGSLSLGQLRKNRPRQITALVLAVFVVLPYLLFFAVFNASEMLLYSAPLLPLIIGWLGRDASASLGDRAPVALTLIGAVLVLQNAWAISTYP